MMWENGEDILKSLILAKLFFIFIELSYFAHQKEIPRRYLFIIPSFSKRKYL